MTRRGQIGKDLGADYTSMGNTKYRNLKARMALVLLREIKKPVWLDQDKK